PDVQNPGEIALALSRTFAAAERCGANLARRRRNTVVAGAEICRRFRCRSLDQRRIAQSDPKFQSARNERGRFDGKISWRKKAGRSECWKRRWRARRLRRARWARSRHLHAARHSTRERYRVS